MENKERGNTGEDAVPGRQTWQGLYRERGTVQQEPSAEVIRFLPRILSRGVSRVLDLGCRTGRHAELLSGEGVHVCGCDNSGEALAICRERVPGIETAQAEMTDLPYEDDSFDSVLCYQVIQHARMEQVGEAVCEMARVLKPGGILFLRVPSTQHPESTTGEEIEAGTRLGIDAIDGACPHHFFTGDELRTLFAGFEILELVHKEHPSEKDSGRPAASWSMLARAPME